MQADICMACAIYVPQEALDGLMTCIYKKRNLPRSTLDSFRGIRVTSSLGKVSCRILADPILTSCSFLAQSSSQAASTTVPTCSQ